MPRLLMCRSSLARTRHGEPGERAVESLDECNQLVDLFVRQRQIVARHPRAAVPDLFAQRSLVRCLGLAQERTVRRTLPRRTVAGHFRCRVLTDMAHGTSCLKY